MSNYARAFGATNFGERTVDVLEGIVSDPKTLLAESRARIQSREAPYHQLDILSTDRYPSAPMPPTYPGHGTKRRASSPYYGGIYLPDELDDRERSPSTDGRPKARASKPRPAKRVKRTSWKEESAEGVHAKQRGRPRLDTQDETAADRRRTQIRLAQRAYRHRKETTIAGLKRQVATMETTVHAMQRSFLELHDNLIDSGLLTAHAALARQLRTTHEQFTAWDKSTATESDLEDAAHMTSLQSGREASISPEQVHRPPSPVLDPMAWGYAAVETTAEDAVVKQVSMTQDDVVQKTGSELLSSTYWSGTLSSDGRYDVERLDGAAVVTIPRSLQSARGYTYSFQETTLARRLHRLCLERAFHVLTNPHLDHGFLNRVFRFTFCFSNKKNMVLRFQDLLKRKAGESLENWNTPFFHIGGAGTHYPRRDERGNPVYPPNMHSPARVLGPRPYATAETPREENLEQLLETLGFGGEWFDSHDVEEYLKTKGIYLTGQSSFFEVDPATLVLPALTASSTSSQSEVSPVRTPSPPSPLPLPHGQLDYAVEPLPDVLQEIFGSLSYPATIEKENQWAPNWQEAASAGLTPRHLHQLSPRSVTVDVSKFLERMVDGGACLGRAPGFRRELVDNALALSVQEAF